jgi:hypothetical protein
MCLKGQPLTSTPSCIKFEEGETVRDRDTGAIYLVQNQNLRGFPNMDIYRAWGSPTVRNFPTQILDACLKGPPLTSTPSCINFEEGETVRDRDTGAIYLVQNQRLHTFPNMDIYRAWGSPALRNFPKQMLDACPKGPPLAEPSCPDLKEGDAMRNRDTGAIYLVQNQKLRTFPNMDIYRAWGSPTVRNFPTQMLDTCPMGPPLTPTPSCINFEEGEAVRDRDTGAIYLVQNGNLRIFSNMDIYRAWGSPALRNFPKQMLDACPKGQPLTPTPTCINFEEGETVRDRDTGAIYLVQNQKLRTFPNMDIYRAWGSPAVRNFPTQMLDVCPKGPALTEPPNTTPAPTSAPGPAPTSAPGPAPAPTPPITTTSAPITSAPITTTAAPIPPIMTTAPPTLPITTTTAAPGPDMDPTLYLLIHQDTYDMEGKLHVLAARFGSLILEPYRQRELSQIFFTNNMGMLRNGAGQGEYVEHNEGCLAPVLTRSPGDESTWQIRNTGKHQYSYRITSACGSPLHSEPGSTVVDLATSTSGTSWYVIPVGTASFS